MNRRDLVRETAPKYRGSHSRLTYDDYCRLPPGRRFEIVDGELVSMPSPSIRHQEISKRLGRFLMEQVEDTGFGAVFFSPTDVVLGPYDVVQPDILCVMRDRLSTIEEACVKGAPDLVIEILSPSTAEWDRVNKRRAYSLHGVREMWIVDPAAESVEVTFLNGNVLATAAVFSRDDIISSNLLPGLALPLQFLFRR